MTAERDHLVICIPLTAGIACAMLISKHLLRISSAGYIAAALTFTLCCTLVSAILMHKTLRTSIPAWSASFFLCGALCHFENSLLVMDVGNGILAGIRAREAMVCSVIDTIPFKNSECTALVKALITGNRSGLSMETKIAFRQAGAAHMLALSGMHLGIIYLILKRGMAIFGNTPAARLCRSFSCIVLTGLYTILCGAGASLLRAWLFIALNECGKMTGRPQNGGRVLCTALSIHLIFRPSDLLEPGFQLSYLAMAGIIFVWPHMRAWYKTPGTGKKIWDLSTLSISCQLFTGPISYLYFHNFPKFFILTNLLGAPLLSAVMFCSITALALTASGIPDCFIYDCLEKPVEIMLQLLECIKNLENFV